MKQSIGFGKLFHGWVCGGTTENAQKYTTSHRFLLITTDLKFDKLLNFLLSVFDATSPLQSML